jgi:hypothetical protein
VIAGVVSGPLVAKSARQDGVREGGSDDLWYVFSPASIESGRTGAQACVRLARLSSR